MPPMITNRMSARVSATSSSSARNIARGSLLELGDQPAQTKRLLEALLRPLRPVLLSPHRLRPCLALAFLRGPSRAFAVHAERCYPPSGHDPVQRRLRWAELPTCRYRGASG